MERCRVCLKTENLTISLYEAVQINESVKEQISVILFNCTNIQINKDDNKPQNICEFCMEKAKETFNFKLRYEKSDLILENEINAAKSEIECDIADHNILENCSSPLGNRGDRSSSPLQDNTRSKINLSNAEFRCAKCNFECSAKDLLDTHCKEHLEITPEYNLIDNGTITEHICMECSKVFSTIYDLNRHIQLHLNKVRKEDLIEEFDTHSEDVPENFRKCNQCFKVFATIHRLKIHKKIHLAATCDFCGFYAENSKILSIHLEQTHEDKKRLSCPTCGKRFFKNNLFKNHLRIHGSRKHVCEICGMGFTQGGNLMKHIRTHSGSKPFVCLKCGKGFTVKATLKQHISTVHESITKYSCKLCNATFKYRKSLTLHTMKHEGVSKWHKCIMCEKSFDSKNHLKKHLLTHSRSGNYKCEICNKQLKTESTLQNHIKLHSGQKNNMCHFCGKSFFQLISLRMHLKTQHSD